MDNVDGLAYINESGREGTATWSDMSDDVTASRPALSLSWVPCDSTLSALAPIKPVIFKWLIALPYSFQTTDNFKKN